MMCHCGGGHCVTVEQSTIAFNFIFLALITASTPCSPRGMGSFEPALGFGIKRVILRTAAALTSGHSAALKLNSLVLPCWLPISFWLWRGSSWLVFPLASRAGSGLQQPAAPWPHEPLSALPAGGTAATGAVFNMAMSFPIPVLQYRKKEV